MPEQNQSDEDKKIVQAVADPIVNNPYEEPTQFWQYSKEGEPQLITSHRREASYWFKNKRTGTEQMELFAEEESDTLPLVNLLRKDVAKWRSSGYRGASPVTKDLLNHWKDQMEPRRLFFCQREAVETMVYLLEMRMTPGRSARTGYRNFEVSDEDIQLMLAGEEPLGNDLKSGMKRTLVDQPNDEDLMSLVRLGCKMATGSGKTVVMAMLISWAFCNRGKNPASLEFPNAVLVCCPNLTVKNRLQVLRPDSKDNYYDQFGLVPAKYRGFLNTGKVLVTNWHVFGKKNEHSEGGTTYQVVNKGEETNEAFAKGRLGDLFSRLPILVLNDEGHHCWREAPSEDDAKLTADEKADLKEEERTARIWLDGLDRINNAGAIGEGKKCIHATIDLSATPFYLKGSGYAEGLPFPWLVSDFGLVDAIESGIVKIPRIPVDDDVSSPDEAGRPDPKYFRLWKHINEKIPRAERLSNKRPKPEAVYREAESALKTLAGQWQQRFKLHAEAGENKQWIPPVLIVVCDNTEIANIFFKKISGEREEEIPQPNGRSKKETVYEPASSLLPELANSDNFRPTIQIDSKMLQKLKAADGESKDEAVEALRRIIDTVGQKGEPGENIRCVVSVSMLTEGWDANNVTHILGVRAFGTQLLCEQVVGRGLRRMNYTPDPETGKLPPEYVDVYGIPFSIIPFKGRKTNAEAPEDKPKNHVHAVSEKDEFAMRFPIVEGFVYGLKESGIKCDVDSLEKLDILHEPTEVFLEVTRGYKEGTETRLSADLVRHSREEFYDNVHFQTILFEIAKRIVDDLVAGATSASDDDRARLKLQAKHLLFPEVLTIVRQFVDKKVKFPYGLGIDKRELGLEKYVELTRQRIRDGILPKAADKDSPLVPVLNSYRPFLMTKDVDYVTTRNIIPLGKSHLNAMVYRSQDEVNAVKKLEEWDWVKCFSPNDTKINFKIPYDYGPQKHLYEPDFMVKLENDLIVLLEIKGTGGEIYGEDRDKVNAKNAAAKKWVEAVNNHGRLGRWAFDIARSEVELEEKLKAFLDTSDGKAVA